MVNSFVLIAMLLLLFLNYLLFWINHLFYTSILLVQPVLHDWCNKGCGMCYPVCGMMHIKEPLLLIGKSSPCGGSGFPLSLSEWSFTICLTPITVNKMCWVRRYYCFINNSLTYLAKTLSLEYLLYNRYTAVFKSTATVI